MVSFGVAPLSVSMDSSEIFLLIEQVKDTELLSQGRIETRILEKCHPAIQQVLVDKCEVAAD